MGKNSLLSQISNEMVRSMKYDGELKPCLDYFLNTAVELTLKIRY